jgi:hypothetical protein
MAELREEELEQDIGKYHVTLQLSIEYGEQRSHGWVEYQDYCSSFEMLSHNGAIEDSRERQYVVSQPNIDKIEKWLIKNGY